MSPVEPSPDVIGTMGDPSTDNAVTGLRVFPSIAAFSPKGAKTLLAVPRAARNERRLQPSFIFGLPMVRSISPPALLMDSRPLRCPQFQSENRQESIRPPCRRAMEPSREKNRYRKSCSGRRIEPCGHRTEPYPWALGYFRPEADREILEGGVCCPYCCLPARRISSARPWYG